MTSSIPRPWSAREPAWRWLAAVSGERPRASQASADRWLLSAKCFLSAARQARSGQARRRVARRYPLESFAFSLWSGRQQALRTAIEARVLAELDPAEIGQHSGLPATYVRAYEAVFFDVRDRTWHLDFVARVVIGLESPTNSPEDAVRRSQLLLAWLGGPTVANEVLCPVDWAFSDHAPRVAVWEAAAASFRRQAALTAVGRGSGFRADGAIAKLLARSEATALASQQHGRQDAFLANVAAFLERMQLTVGGRGIEDEDLHLYTGPAEPRADEFNNGTFDRRLNDLDYRQDGKDGA